MSSVSPFFAMLAGVGAEAPETILVREGDEDGAVILRLGGRVGFLVATSQDKGSKTLCVRLGKQQYGLVCGCCPHPAYQFETSPYDLPEEELQSLFREFRDQVEDACRRGGIMILFLRYPRIWDKKYGMIPGVLLEDGDVENVRRVAQVFGLSIPTWCESTGTSRTTSSD